MEKMSEFYPKSMVMNKSTRIAARPLFTENTGSSAIGELAQSVTENTVPGATNHLPASYWEQEEKQWVKNTRIPYIVRNDDLSLREFLIF
jgi:hypothetical protein